MSRYLVKLCTCWMMSPSSTTQACYTGTLDWPIYFNTQFSTVQHVPLAEPTKAPTKEQRKPTEYSVWVWKIMTGGGREWPVWEMDTHACQISPEKKLIRQMKEKKLTVVTWTERSPPFAMLDRIFATYFESPSWVYILKFPYKVILPNALLVNLSLICIRKVPIYWYRIFKEGFSMVSHLWIANGIYLQWFYTTWLIPVSESSAAKNKTLPHIDRPDRLILPCDLPYKVMLLWQLYVIWILIGK